VTLASGLHKSFPGASSTSHEELSRTSRALAALRVPGNMRFSRRPLIKARLSRHSHVSPAAFERQAAVRQVAQSTRPSKRITPTDRLVIESSLGHLASRILVREHLHGRTQSPTRFASAITAQEETCRPRWCSGSFTLETPTGPSCRIRRAGTRESTAHRPPARVAS
jgi:hypothetical protein